LVGPSNSQASDGFGATHLFPGKEPEPMKKILISVFVLLLIAVFVLPFVGANKTEQTFNNWIAQVNQAGAYDLSWESYDKGWLQTEAVLKVGLKPGVVPAALLDEGENAWYLPVHLQLNHGPVLWLDGLRLGWFSGEFFLDEKHQMWLEHNLQKQGEGQFFVSNIHMNLFATTTLQDRSLPFSLVMSSGETIQVSAYSGEGVISRSGKLEYQGKLPSFSASGDDIEVAFSDAAFQLQSDFGNRAGKYVTPGYGEFSFKKIAIKGEEDWTFDIADLSLVSDLQINDAKTLVETKIKMAFSDLNVMGENISKAQLDLGFRNLSVVFLDQYLAIVQDTYAGDGEPNPMLAMQAMDLASQHLLPAGPQIHVNSFAFTTPEGSLEFNGHLALAPEAAQHISNPMAMIPYVSVETSLLVAKPLAFRLARRSTLNELDAVQFEGGSQMTDAEKEALADNQTQMKLDMLTLQGMLVDKGERYSSEFRFKNGQAELNGQAMPLPF
jgi:uncharacterized protein YdgA (DUF945 family)